MKEMSRTYPVNNFRLKSGLLIGLTRFFFLYSLAFAGRPTTAWWFRSKGSLLLYFSRFSCFRYNLIDGMSVNVCFAYERDTVPSSWVLPGGTWKPYQPKDIKIQSSGALPPLVPSSTSNISRSSLLSLLLSAHVCVPFLPLAYRRFYFSKIF